jgi:hypothetical protein
VRRGPNRSPALRLLPAVGALLAAGCGSDAPVPSPALGTAANAVSVDQTAHDTCGTPDELVTGLSRQLVDAINCLRPGTLVDIPLDAVLRMLEAGRPNLIDGRALADLRAAAADGDRQMVVRWAYRDVGLQQLFWLQDAYQGCAVAARPGSSNHQNGLAVDLNDWQYWEPIMRRHGWENNLANDRVHFDYQRVEDIGLGSFSLYAFQELWNLNHPEAPLPTGGALDAETDAALAGAPIEGLPRDLCRNGVPPAAGTVEQAAWRACDAPAGLARGLSAQVVRTMNCLEPGALVSLDACPGCVAFDVPAALHWAAPEVEAALRAAARAFGRAIPLHWAFRDVAVDHFLALAAEHLACPAALGAAHGALGTGLGIETRDAAPENALSAAGFDAVPAEGEHVYRVPGEDRTSLSVLAFQRLWNLNEADPPLEEDGRIGPATRGAIARSPVAGFAEEPCAPIEPPPVSDAGAGAGGALPPVDAAIGGASGSGGVGGDPGDLGPAPSDASRRDAGPTPTDADTPDDAAPDDATPGPGPGPDGGGNTPRTPRDAGPAETQDAALRPADARLPEAPLAGWTGTPGGGGCRAVPTSAAAAWFGVLWLLRRRRR